MGTWGEGSLDNDGAADWFADLEEAPSAETVRAALERVTGAEYVEAPEGAEALAAAEVVAAALGRPLSGPDGERLGQVAAACPETARMASQAVEAVRAVRASGASELRELWDEADPDEWLAATEDLGRRLES